MRFVMRKQFDGIHKQICTLLFPVITFTYVFDKMLVQSMCVNNRVTYFSSKYFGKDTIYCDDRGGKCAIILAVSCLGGHYRCGHVRKLFYSIFCTILLQKL